MKLDRLELKNVRAVLNMLFVHEDLAYDEAAGFYRTRCVIHGGENATSLAISDKGLYHCFACGAKGNLISLVVAVTKMPWAQAIQLLDDIPNLALNVEDVPKLPAWETRFASRYDRYPVMNDSMLIAYKYRPRYLIKRGFTQEILLKYEVGYDQLNRRIVLPARDVLGRLVGLTFRADDDITEPKYLHEHWDKSEHLYGLYLVLPLVKQVRTLYLVEGQLDSQRLMMFGAPAVAIMGSSVSEDQIELISNWVVNKVPGVELVCMFDNDDAGIKCTNKFISQTRHIFGNQVPIYVGHYPGKDPGVLKSTEAFINETTYLLPQQWKTLNADKLRELDKKRTGLARRKNLR